ncbi:S8 family peptidase [Shewanella schlegeliana]|uniref:S8 family peptidase n=1 Tax=Shewanella schlegeliana TaxID=190308 RepID=A0ABS1T3Q0_9GAMM|nr:S8 family peptidase [Shewanella schlegeliana]MBL4914106.1 S8 family peptidase [Shewanella schlegeliana]MCL1110857.1 S8 family peptidase [Shewanella schlegeliana]GIU38640.1 subtilisin proteinase [Shewanella schlegeliana]
MKKHFKISPSKSLLSYRSIPMVVRTRDTNIDRAEHFSSIRASFDRAVSVGRNNIAFAQSRLEARDVPNTVLLSISESAANPNRLKIESLDNNNIELLSVNTVDGLCTANVAIPLERIERFSNTINQYGHENTSSGNAKNKPLIESISEIRSTSIRDLWFSNDPIPDESEVRTYELWFTSKNLDFDDIEVKLATAANISNLTIRNGRITFKDRLVKLVSASLEQLNTFQVLTNLIVEVRPATTVCSEYINMSPSEQRAWSEGLTLTRSPNAVPICILDSGVNIGHPLLSPISDSEVQVQYDPSWSAGDQLGHGTWMAGTSIYGDLKHQLTNMEVEITGKVESGKIISGINVNDPELYGLITSHVVYSVDSMSPSDKRIYTLAVTADYTLLGAPSSWSATIDELASETPDDPTTRLFVVSAGNFILNSARDIPTTNQNSSVQDPANAYNALTVGYWCSEGLLNQSGYELFAELTDIGPTSTSSHSWHRGSPLKPEVIFEGGNFGYDTGSEFTSEFEDLSILTTSHDFSNGDYLTYFGETSAATALASHFISKVWAKYPDYSPETIRGLVIHSAEWPEKLLSRFAPLRTKPDVESLLRLGGYGYPNLTKALSSGDRNVNLVIEDSIQPYTSDGKLNEMALYALPWPSNELSKLENEVVKLRVTLSYFIEPNPGERGWSNKYKYCSHGLRFELNSAEEDQDEFSYRINQQYRIDNPDTPRTDSDSSKWLLGQKLRSHGSIHSDIWEGTGRELAEKKFLAVYPVAGWWKELRTENRQSSVAKYSLIVSIESSSNNLDIYNEIENLIELEIPIETTVTI